MKGSVNVGPDPLGCRVINVVHDGCKVPSYCPQRRLARQSPDSAKELGTATNQSAHAACKFEKGEPTNPNVFDPPVALSNGRTHAAIRVET